YQHIARYSASFALAADAAMLTLGGELKRRETLSARLGDMLSYLYLTSMVLKHYEDQGQPAEDLPLVEWACRTLLYRTQEQLHGLLRNFPSRPVALLLRIAVFPRGRTYFAPSDELCQRIAELVINPTEARRRLADCAYITPEPTNPLGLMQQALERAEQVRPIERKIHEARRAGRIKREDVPGQIDEAERLGVIDSAEAEQLREFDRTVMALTAVDDFDVSELGRSRADGFFAGGRSRETSGASHTPAAPSASDTSGTSDTPSTPDTPDEAAETANAST